MPAVIRRTVATSVVMLLMGLFGVERATAAVVRPSGPLVPTDGLLLGAYVDPDGQWTNNETALEEAADYEALVNHKLDINQHYYSWTNTFPSGLEQADLAAGRTPLVSWGGTDLDQILSGAHDDQIRARADGMAALGEPVFLRWCWEMNGNWGSCDGFHNNDPGTKSGPAEFVAAWRHIHGIFQQRGATNVIWVWAPNNKSIPDDPWNHWSSYYPGDAHVDWVGIDGYNWGEARSWSSWTSFSDTFRAVYDDYASKKPIMISETASTEIGGDKAGWIENARQVLKTQYPSIAALVWFHVLKETDWRVDSSAASLAAYRSMAADPYFNQQPAEPPPPDDGIADAPDVKKLKVNPHRVRHKARVGFTLTERSDVTVRVQKAGAVIRGLKVNDTMPKGRHRVKWNGRRKNGHKVAPGRYRIVVYAENESGKHQRYRRVRVL